MQLAVPLCIVRHGETDWNVEGRLQGQKDIALNGRGRAQAEAVGRELARLHPEVTGFDFVSSPLLRAQETMRILRTALRLEPGHYTVDDDLRELTFGSWEGFTWNEVRDHDPVGAAGREADKWAFVPPGGENYAMLAERIAGWLGTIERPTLAVTHGGVARVLLGLLCGMNSADVPLQEITQGRAMMFEAGAWRWI